jgi:hypothetical protein
MAKPNCHACRFFRVTWDERLPYECEAFGFRSSRLPALVVRETSGKHCSLFRPKAAREAEDA